MVCFGVGLAGCESSGKASGDRLVREYAECMADSNSALHRRMASGETGAIPLSVVVAEARVRAQLQRGELTMAEIAESYARLCG
jgi:hypothetical protein